MSRASQTCRAQEKNAILVYNESMEIEFFGQSCFRFKGKNAVVVTDPYSTSGTGLSKLKKLSADIVTVSHQHEDHNFVGAIKGTDRRPKPFVIDGPGEYEIDGIFIQGISSYHDQKKGKERGKNTIYCFEIDGLRLVHLGDLGTELSRRQLEEVNGSDILLVPVGGTFTIDAAEAMKVVNQVEPQVVIPMHYKLPGLKYDLAGVEDFLKEAGVEEVKPEEKLNISKDKLPDSREIIVLKF